jgi:hypothetical protein
MSLSIAIAQIQMRPQYHHSYSDAPKTEAGRPMSHLRLSRKAKLLEIIREIGETQLAPVIAIMHKTDPKIHEDDARKMIGEMVSDRLIERRVAYIKRRLVFYKARPV